MTELINSEAIYARTKILAKEITIKHKNDGTPIVFICLLYGGFMFFSELVKSIDLDVECEFMRVKSYIKRKQGDIKITKDVETPIMGKHVYIVDDILDSGNTLKAVQQFLEIKKPASLTAVSLLTRKNSPQITMNHLNAFVIDDEWVVGFGLGDEEGYARNFTSVYACEPES
jgi:Hypoxanthine-guanine phosphoribosyltransferase